MLGFLIALLVMLASPSESVQVHEVPPIHKGEMSRLREYCANLEYDHVYCQEHLDEFK